MRRLVLLTLAVAGACAGTPPTPSPSPSPTQVPPGPLVTITTTGGMCPAAACESTIYIERDGRVHEGAKPPNDLGVVPAEQLAALEDAINTGDFIVLLAPRFTGQCPTAFDGQEITIEFNGPEKVERFSTCGTVIDWSDPLFVALRAAVAPFFDLPAS